MHVNTVHTAALAKMTKPAVVHPGKILPGKLLFSLSIYVQTQLVGKPAMDISNPVLVFFGCILDLLQSFLKFTSFRSLLVQLQEASWALYLRNLHRSNSEIWRMMGRLVSSIQYICKFSARLLYRCLCVVVFLYTGSFLLIYFRNAEEEEGHVLNFRKIPCMWLSKCCISLKCTCACMCTHTHACWCACAHTRTLIYKNIFMESFHLLIFSHSSSDMPSKC